MTCKHESNLEEICSEHKSSLTTQLLYKPKPIQSITHINR